jgi:hypothetical protein
MYRVGICGSRLTIDEVVILLTFLCEFFSPRSAFPILIWIQIHDSQINADPDLDPNPQHCLSGIILKSTVYTFKTTNQNNTLIFYFPSRFEVPAEQRMFFSDVNFHGAVATFFHAVCVGKLRYSEGAESVAIWLQRKVAGINEPGDKSISFSTSGIISSYHIIIPVPSQVRYLTCTSPRYQFW